MTINARIAPKIPVNITSPSAELLILEYYKGFYDTAFIMLHPFIKIIDEEKLYANSKDEIPLKSDFVKYTQKVSWSEFLKLSGFDSIERLDVALRNLIGGLADEYKNDSDLLILKKVMEANNLIDPGEGFFSRLLVDDMMKGLLDLNHEWIFIGDEFGFERKLEFIQDIIENKIQINFGHENWYTTFNEILYTTHWDSHFTILCGDQKSVEKIVQKHRFEGFYCDQDTQIYWSLLNPPKELYKL